MCTDASTRPCFLVEWYQPDLSSTSFDDAVIRLQQVTNGGRVQLLGALTAPSDETIFGVLSAESAEAVIDACQQARWRTDRITAVIRADIGA